MKYFLEFIDSEDIKKSGIFASLKCDELEANILRYMSKAMLDGNTDFIVLSMIESVFGVKNQECVRYLPNIKNLIELGWISYSGSVFVRSEDISIFELLNDSVCLSHSFFKLLEDGGVRVEQQKIEPYLDHLEYLKDQFLRVDLLQNINSLKFSQKIESPSLSRAKYRLKILEELIESRLKITQKPLSIVSLIKENSLDLKEQIIFFALLKEEYSSGDTNFRDMNALIELVSQDEYDKIKNRSLLDDKSNLIEKNLVDYDEILNPFMGITKTFFVTDEILTKIMHSNKKKKSKITLESIVGDQEIFEVLEPKKSLSDVVLNPTTLHTLEGLLKQADSNVVNYLKQWGIRDKKGGIEAKIIFFGPPGTGKSMTALALAKELKKQILNFDCSKILSMYVGESEKNVRKIFDSYKDICKKLKNQPILLLDEADQFLSARGSANSGAEKMHNQMQNIFLEQIEKFSGILIATTNLLETIDSAFSRRFNYKIEFKKPTQSQRVSLWEKHLPSNAPYQNQQNLAQELSKYDLSGGQIALIVKNTAYRVATKTKPIFTLQDFVDEIKRELSGNFDSTKSVGFLG